MWAMLAAPLIMGTDVPGMTAETRAILANARLIAIDQDPLGFPALRWRASRDHEVWAKPLAGDRWAIALLNRSDAEQRVTVDWARGELRDDMHGRDPAFADRTYTIENAWTGAAEGTTAEPLEQRVGARDTLVFTLTPQA
jgi:alpha-galactosidase